MYKVRGIPQTYLIAAAGVIRKGNVRGIALESAIAELIQESKAELAPENTGQ